MNDVLSQSEVEALLTALDTSGAKGENPAAVAAAANVAATIAAPAVRHDVTLYDFKRPERVSKEQMRALQTIHEVFGRNISASLSGFLRTIVEVKLVSVDQLTYSEFTFSLENPTCFNVLTCAPLDGHVVLEINPSIVYPMIDRLLGGGRGDVLVPRRPLTDIEERLITRVTKYALEDLKKVWSQIIPIEFKVDRIESNPRLVYIVPPNEVVVLISFEIAIGDLRGMMNFCIPFNSIEPVIDQLSANTWLSYARRDSRKQNVLTALRNAPIEVTVHLGETTITAEQLLDLRVGDCLPIEKSIESPLLVDVGGVSKFWGTQHQFKGRKVVKIVSTASANPRING
jgi:flagellar motor switch protein FliM